MSFDENNYPSAANLVGNVDIPRNVRPTLRSSVRRTDPDGTSAAPYYPSTAGKSLRLTYTTEVASVISTTTTTIVFSGSSLAQIITDINAADPDHLEALDLDGFLAVRNKNPGKSHFISVEAHTTEADDAAPFLGFPVSPLPGSKSFAGEYAATPGSRKQSNPNTTALLALDEDLSSASINRAFYSLLQMVESIRADLNRDVVVYKDLDIAVTLNANTSTRVGIIGNDDIRLYAPAVDIAIGNELEPFFRVLDAGTTPSTALNESTDYSEVRVTNAHYAENASDALTNVLFATWGLPDGGTIFGVNRPNKDKQVAVDITSITGNIVKCDTARFLDNKVKKGDPVELVASNLQPFDHSGWFVVDAVIDETTLALRPMSEAEERPSGTGNKPKWLNPTGGGTLRVAMGWFIPSSEVVLNTNAEEDNVYKFRLPVGVPLRETLVEDTARTFAGNIDALAELLNSHVIAAADAHPASAISGFTTLAWADATTSTGASLEDLINAIVADLTSAFGGGGAGKIGSSNVSIGGLPPNTLSLGTVRSQIIELLTKLRDHINDSSAHGGGAPYSGSPPWADGTSIPAGITIDAAIDNIVADLASVGTGDDGAGKIGIQALTAWLGGRANPATSVGAALQRIITDLGATTASDDGAERIGAMATSDLSAGSVRFQLDSIASGWGKLNRANTWSAKQTMNSTSSDTAAVIDTTYIPTVRKLLWEAALESAGAGGSKVRLYAGRNHINVGYEITINARWDGTNWLKDGLGQGTRLVVTQEGAYLQARLSSDGGVWSDTLSDWHDPLFLTSEKPLHSTAMGPSVTPSNVCRAHGNITTGPAWTTNGFNFTAASVGVFPDRGIRVTFASPLSSSNYTVIPHNNVAGGGYSVYVNNQTTTHFDMTVYNDSGEILDSEGVTLNVNFMVFGD